MCPATAAAAGDAALPPLARQAVPPGHQPLRTFTVIGAAGIVGPFAVAAALLEPPRARRVL